MRAFLILALVLAFPLLLQAQDDASKAEAEKIQGHWRLVSLGTNGTTIDFPEGNQQRITFKDKKVLNEKSEELFSFELDRTVTPAILDFTNLKDKKQVLEGIYKLEDNVLTVCVHNGQGVRQRPADYDFRQNPSLILIVLKKEN